MKPRHILVAFLLGLEVRDRLTCWRRGHDTYRHPLGYFACRRCPKKAADLGGFGMLQGGYVRRWKLRA